MEDDLETVFVRLKTKLDLIEQLQDIFNNAPDPLATKEILNLRKEIRMDMNNLFKNGVNMIDIFAKFGGNLYKSKVL